MHIYDFHITADPSLTPSMNCVIYISELLYSKPENIHLLQDFNTMSNRLQSSYFLSHTIKRDLTVLWPTFAVLTHYSGSHHAVYSLEVREKERHSRLSPQISENGCP